MSDSGRFLRLLLGVLVLPLQLLAQGTPAPGIKPFDIPAGPADAALRKFAAQSGLELLYSTETVDGVRTNLVQGNFAPLEALASLLKGTPLAHVPDSKSGVLRIARASDLNPPRAAVPANGRPTERSQATSESDSFQRGGRVDEVRRPNPSAPATRPGSTTAPTEQESPIELTPFVVSEKSDTGWIATETLAGTRLRTSFKDVPNQLETLTKDFMDDLGLNSAQQALIYTANAENNSEFMPAAPGNQVSDPSRAGRVRGAGTATLSRNFFQSSIQSDNYNTERVTVASGPSAILFGLGSPTGIMDATPARANVQRNRFSVSQQFDSENSKRTTWDANFVILPKRLALRVEGLDKKEYTARKPNSDREDRRYGAITITPTNSTTLTLQREEVNRAWNNAPRILPVEFITPWLYADKIPGSGYTTPKPTYNNTSFPNITSNVVFAQQAQAAVFIQGGAVPVMNWRNSVLTRNPAVLPGVNPIDRGLDITLLDRSIFPFDVNVVGESRTTRLGGNNSTAILEQKLANNLFLELAYNAEGYYNSQYTAGGRIGSNSFKVWVDPNQFLPGTTTPNPFLGQYYTQGSAGNAFTFVDRHDWRGTLSYDWDLGQKLAERSRWGKWLGRHRFAGLYSGGTKESRDQLNFDRRIMGEPVITGLALTQRTTENWATNATRLPQYRHYFTSSPYDPTRAFGPFTGTWTEYDSRGNPFELSLLETGMRSAGGKRLAAGNPVAAIRSDVTSQVLAWQGFFLPDSERVNRLVLTYGYRKDTAKSQSADVATVSKDFSGLYPVLWDATYDPYGPEQAGINRNVGAVVRPLRWLSLFYNRSTTFDLNVGKYDPFGEQIPGASGKGRDYGIRLDLLTNKLALRVNRYQNTTGPQRVSNEINGYAGNFANIENRVRELDPSSATINVKDGNLRGYPSAGTMNYIITSNAESKGVEVGLDCTPVPNWSIRLNGSTSKAIESNIGSPWFKWVAVRLPVWQAVVAKNGERDAAGRPVTWTTAGLNANDLSGGTLADYYNNQIVGNALAYMTAADGRATETARGARANLITSYNFIEGRLKGFNLGGAARWRAAPTIGYGATTNAAGTTLFDLDRAYKGKDEFYVDPALGYRGKIRAFGGINYRVQLNVRNVLNQGDVVPVQAFVTGAVAKLAWVEPRTYVMKFEVTY